MTSRHDFDFAFGKDRYLRGSGWRGLLALTLLLIGMLLAAGLGKPLLKGGMSLLGM